MSSTFETSLLLEHRSPAALASGQSLLAGQPNTVTPDVALSLDHAWTEPSAVAKQAAGIRATKVFLAEDTMGETYVCYLQAPNKTLAVVQYDLRPKKPHFGAVNHLAAVDAVPLPALQMTLVLEPQQHHPPMLALYSGLLKVARVMYDANPRLGGTQLAHIAHEIGALNLDSKPGTPMLAAGGKRHLRAAHLDLDLSLEGGAGVSGLTPAHRGGSGINVEMSTPNEPVVLRELLNPVKNQGRISQLKCDNLCLSKNIHRALYDGFPTASRCHT